MERSFDQFVEEYQRRFYAGLSIEDAINSLYEKGISFEMARNILGRVSERAMRMCKAIDLVVSKRGSDGWWSLDTRYPGKMPVEMD